jgi:hypothetical protein
MPISPLDLQREIHRRWLRFSEGRPKHPNDIRRVPKRSGSESTQVRKSEFVEVGHEQTSPSLGRQRRDLMEC